MNEPQVWTLIGVFASGLFGMLTLMSTMFVRIVRTEVGSIRGQLSSEIGGLRSEMHSEFKAVRTDIKRVEEVMSTRFAHLERDVAVISRKVFDDPPAA